MAESPELGTLGLGIVEDAGLEGFVFTGGYKLQILTRQ